MHQIHAKIIFNNYFVDFNFSFFLHIFTELFYFFESLENACSVESKKSLNSFEASLFLLISSRLSFLAASLSAGFEVLFFCIPANSASIVSLDCVQLWSLRNF